MPIISSILTSGFARASNKKFEDQFVYPGTYYWTVPNGVSSISVVAIGGGGGGQKIEGGGGGGVGGQLRYVNDVSVNEGDVYIIVVGDGGEPGNNIAGYRGGNTTITLQGESEPLLIAFGGPGGEN